MKKLLGFMVASTLLVVFSAGQAHALSCKSYYVTHNVAGYSSMTYGKAKRNARIKWRATVRLKPSLGWSWSDWGKARNKSYSCKKVGAFGNGRKCWAKARPCK